MTKKTTNPKIQQSTNPLVALVTAPDLKTARRLAKIILQSRLAACANLVPKIESHYWWDGKLEKSAEVLMILKTTSARLPELQKAVLENHPYDTPEFIVLSTWYSNSRMKSP